MIFAMPFWTSGQESASSKFWYILKDSNNLFIVTHWSDVNQEVTWT